MLILYSEKSQPVYLLTLDVWFVSDVSVSQVSNCRLQAPLNTLWTLFTVNCDTRESVFYVLYFTFTGINL